MIISLSPYATNPIEYMDNALAVINVALISNAPLSKSNLTIGLDNTIAPIDIGITKIIILFDLFTI